MNIRQGREIWMFKYDIIWLFYELRMKPLFTFYGIIIYIQFKIFKVYMHIIAEIKGFGAKGFY